MATMTKHEAKALAIELWQYLADHPEVQLKRYVAPELYDKVKDLACECPLCEVHPRCGDGPSHRGCPLFPCSSGVWSPYSRWLSRHSTNDDRRSAALAIVDAVTAWEV